MTQAYRALHHNGGMVVKYPGCFLDLTRFNHPQTDNFIQLLFRDAGMQAKFGNSKSHRNISHYAFPQSLRGSKDDWASASCCHSAAVFSSGFGGITIFSTAYRSPVCFLLTRPLPLTRNRCPAWLPGGIVSKMLSFSVGTVTLAPSAASHGLTGTTISRSWPTISNSGCGAI